MSWSEVSVAPDAAGDGATMLYLSHEEGVRQAGLRVSRYQLKTLLLREGIDAGEPLR